MGKPKRTIIAAGYAKLLVRDCIVGAKQLLPAGIVAAYRAGEKV
jgi:hypothetical protein